MQYELLASLYDDPIHVEVKNDLTCNCGFTLPSGSLHEPSFGTFPQKGSYQGIPVEVNINLRLENNYLELQIVGSSWSSIEETEDSLKLKRHLLRELKRQWLSTQDTDPLGADAIAILKRAEPEIALLDS